MLTPASPLSRALADIVGADRVLTRPLDLAVHATDASVYRLVPRAIVRPRTAEEVSRVFALCRAYGVPLTFRAAGTSLSGQAVTDGVLVDIAHDWRAVDVLDEGRRVRVQPGVVGAAVNERLRRFGAKMGPDPASLQACMVGGILANNSSGMCCGVVQNAYHTLESIAFVLPSGTSIDTSDPRADDALRQAEPALWAGIADLRREVLADPALVARIRRKYLTKNTTGYSLNAFVDFERPLDVLAHLLIGSEGTLAFIASAVLRTVPDLPVKYTGLLLFPGIRDACAAITPLATAGAAALEVMDRASLRSVEHHPGVPPSIARLPRGAAGLLAEFQAGDEAGRPALEARATEALSRLVLLEPPRFSHQPAEQAALWTVRQGMLPSIGAARRRGTAVIIEDVAFPIDRLADAVTDLGTLFGKHGYQDAIIFGHAKDGNLHFVLSQSFNDRAAVAQYERLMNDVVDMVVHRYDGALKAEHGTGRNVAPFVETEWGPDAYRVMRRLKALVDPAAVLNPGVIITSDPSAHLANLKALPPVDAEVDACTECGFCEPRCPSRDLTLTPRQRIVVRREIERLRSRGGSGAAVAAIEADLVYDALDTCAADSLCAAACPAGIDTGALTKHLRTVRHRAIGHHVAALVARHFGATERLIRLALTGARLAHGLVGQRVLEMATRLPRLLLPRGTPLWLPPMPAAAPRRPSSTARDGATAVYFPSCVSRTMGHLPGEPDDMPLAEALVRVADRAQRPVWIPEDAAGHCCGVPFSSKGYVEANRLMVNRTVESFWRWSDEGRLPVVVDTSPCTYGLRNCRGALTEENQERFDALTILDSIQYAADTLLPRLQARRRQGRVVLHPVCSVVKMNLTSDLERVARACADEVVVPFDAGCCAFAGDRGWLVPELTASAMRHEAAEVASCAAGGHYSSSRTCEIGLTRATGAVYRSYLYLLEWATRPEIGAPCGRP